MPTPLFSDVSLRPAQLMRRFEGVAREGGSFARAGGLWLLLILQVAASSLLFTAHLDPADGGEALVTVAASDAPATGDDLPHPGHAHDESTCSICAVAHAVTLLPAPSQPLFARTIHLRSVHLSRTGPALLVASSTHARAPPAA